MLNININQAPEDRWEDIVLISCIGPNLYLVARAYPYPYIAATAIHLKLAYKKLQGNEVRLCQE